MLSGARCFNNLCLKLCIYSRTVKVDFIIDKDCATNKKQNNEEKASFSFYRGLQPRTNEPLTLTEHIFAKPFRKSHMRLAIVEMHLWVSLYIDDVRGIFDNVIVDTVFSG